MNGHTTATVPQHLVHIGQVVGAIPVHRPVDTDDYTQWIVLCDRGTREEELAGKADRFSTNRVSRDPNGDTVAEGGVYDLTYDQALADMLDRAGHAPITEVKVWSLTVDTKDYASIHVSVHPTREDALQRLRDEVDGGGDLSQIADGDLVVHLEDELGYDVEIDEHTVVLS